MTDFYLFLYLLQITILFFMVFSQKIFLIVDDSCKFVYPHRFFFQKYESPLFCLLGLFASTLGRDSSGLTHWGVAITPYHIGSESGLTGV